MARSRGHGGRPKSLSGLQPLAYMGVEASQPPQLVHDPDRDPDSGTSTVDRGMNKFLIGTLWVNTELNRIWMLTNLDSAIATWTRMGGVEDLVINGNIGQAAPDANFEIDMPGEGVLYTTGAGNVLTLGMTASTDGQIIIGQTAGLPDWGNLTSLGATITVTEGANTLNIEVAAGTLGARIFDCDVGVAIVAGQTIVMAGGLNINTHGATNVVTINTDVFPVFDNVQLDDLIQGFVEIDATGKFVTSQGTDGQLVIGGTGVRAQWANLTSADNSITITEGTNTLDVGVSDWYDGWAFSPYVVQQQLAVIAVQISAMCYDSGAGVFVIGSAPAGAASIDTAPDPAGAWTNRPITTPIGSPVSVVDLHYGGGNNVGISIQKIVVAPDATGAWTHYFYNAGHDAYEGYRVAYGNGMWVATGRDIGPGFVPIILTTADPTNETWVRNVTGITEIVKPVMYANGIWIIGGENGTIFTAVDPTGAWTSRANPFSTDATVGGCVYSPELGIFVMACNGGTQPGVQLATSTDGITWTPRPIPTVMTAETRILWDAVNGLFMTYGHGAARAVSRDGKNWIFHNEFAQSYLCAAVANGQIAGGSQGAAGDVMYTLISV